MNRPATPTPRTRTLAQLEDTLDLESVISTALAARPIDQRVLRRAYGPMSARNVTPEHLWCVEAYFGHLGGESDDRIAAK
jgi:hypothetical protein